jgi:hypothetical protein
MGRRRCFSDDIFCTRCIQTRVAKSGLLRSFIVAAFTLAAGAQSAGASVTVLVGEPFGSFGHMMPTGHSTIYLDRVCADGPLHVRMCQPGEPAGVAIARLDAIGKVDWIASPIMDFLYGVDDVNDVLPYATAAQVNEIRERYRHRAMQEVLPDGTEKLHANADWWETVGAAYIRRMWGYELATTREQDEQLVAMLNADENQHRYHLHRLNCADFAAELINFYYPGMVKENKLADLHLLTPKQVARCVSAYGHAHPEAELKIIEVRQIPGTLPRSHPVRGACDMLLKTKMYSITLAVIQPEADIALFAMYMDRGRWDIGRNSVVAVPADFYQVAQPAGVQASVGDQTDQ